MNQEICFFDKSGEMNNNLGVSPSLSVGGRAIRHSLHSRYRSVTFKQHLLSLTRETSNHGIYQRARNFNLVVLDNCTNKLYDLDEPNLTCPKCFRDTSNLARVKKK